MTENVEVSYNLVEDLNILFVDIDNRDGRRQYSAVEKFFQADTILWDFIHYYLPLKHKPDKIDALNVYDVLKANYMGYTHIVVNGKRWEEFSPKEHEKLIKNFKENVRKLKPQLLIVLGRKTYDELFKNEVPRIRGTMKVGFHSHSISWHQKGKKKGSTKIFLMRKTRFKSPLESRKSGKLLCSAFKKLMAFKEKHGNGFTSVELGKRKRDAMEPMSAAEISSYMNKYLEPNYHEDRASKKAMTTAKFEPTINEPDEISSSSEGSKSGAESGAESGTESTN